MSSVCEVVKYPLHVFKIFSLSVHEGKKSGKCGWMVELLYKVDKAGVHLNVKDRHKSVILTLVVMQSVTHCHWWQVTRAKLGRLTFNQLTYLQVFPSC